MEEPQNLNAEISIDENEEVIYEFPNDEGSTEEEVILSVMHDYTGKYLYFREKFTFPNSSRLR